MEQLELKVGREYKIFNYEAEKSQTSFKGIYIGHNPLTTSGFQKIRALEGHVFVKRNNEGELEFYCSRTEKGLELRWYSDGDDGPDWPAGFRAEKVDVKLSESEIKYLQNRLNAWRGLKAA